MQIPEDGQLWQTLCDARLAGLHGSVRIATDQGANWRVSIADGRATVSNEVTSADGIVHIAQADLAGIITGRLNPLTLFLRGRIKVHGRPELSLVVLRLLPNVAWPMARTAEPMP